MNECPLCETGEVKEIKYHTYSEMECNNCGKTIDELHLDQDKDIRRLRDALKLMLVASGEFEMDLLVIEIAEKALIKE